MCQLSLYIMYRKNNSLFYKDNELLFLHKNEKKLVTFIYILSL